MGYSPCGVLCNAEAVNAFTKLKLRHADHTLAVFVFGYRVYGTYNYMCTSHLPKKLQRVDCVGCSARTEGSDFINYGWGCVRGWFAAGQITCEKGGKVDL